MTIRAECPECGERFTVPERLDGKLVRCKGCDARFRVGGEEEEAAPSGFGMLPVWLIGGALLLGALAVGATFVFRKPADPPVAEGQPPPEKQPPQLPPNEEKPASAWGSVADPGPGLPVLPEGYRANIPASLTERIVHAATPSVFVAVDRKWEKPHAQEVWDLSKGERVGRVEAAPERVALSPDGKLLAGDTGGLVEVWDAATGKPRHSLRAAENKEGLLRFDFAGPSRLLTVSGRRGAWKGQVWDMADGQEKASFPVVAIEGWYNAQAISPGGNFFAHLGKADAKPSLVVHDLRTGKEVVDAPVDAVPGRSLWLLAFSEDGKSLAGLAIRGLQPHIRYSLVTWDAATGREIAEHPCHEVADGLRVASEPDGQFLQWRGGREPALLSGRALIDPGSGKVGWSFANGERTERDRSCRLIGTGHVVRLRESTPNLVVEPLPAEAAAALLALKEGKEPPAEASVPVVPRTDPGGWKATVGGLERGKAFKPFALRSRAGDLARLLFAPEKDRLLALSFRYKGGDRFGPRTLRLDSYDLASGKPLAGADLMEAGSSRTDILGHRDVVADCSPDGGAVLVREPGEPKNLHVWDGEGKKIASWSPFAKERHEGVVAAAFGGPDRILAIGGTAKLVSWDIRKQKTAWVAEGVLGLSAVSPCRAYAAVFTWGGMELVRADTGATVGRMPHPDLRTVHAAAFRPDGKELAVFADGPKGQALIRWDMTTGARIDEFGTGLFLACQRMGYVGEAQVMVNDILVDLKARMPLTARAVIGRLEPSPDGRALLAAAATREEKARLGEAALPDASAKQLAALVAAGKAELAIPPGTVVEVRVEGAKDEAMRARIAATLANTLKHRGWATEGKATATLRVRIGAERPTGRVDMRGALRIVQTEVPMEAVLSDAKGVVWTGSQKPSSPALAELPMGTADPAAEIRKRLETKVEIFSATWPVPYAILRTGTGLVALPVAVPLG